jgi:lambda repressor-like predicted transcriptional regulator
MHVMSMFMFITGHLPMKPNKRPSPSPDVPSDPRERNIWVLAQLKYRGSGYSAVARALGVHRSTVINAMYQANERVEAALAEAIGVDPKTLFAERYDANGTRLHAVRGPKDTTNAGSTNVEAGKAA